MKRGQVSLEYVLILGMLFIILIPFFYYSMEGSITNVKMYKADDAVNTLAGAADAVYGLGPGTKKIVRIELPGGVESTLVNNHEITLKLRISGGVSDVFATTKPEVTGTFPSSKGYHTLKVEYLTSQNKVQISVA